MDMREPPRPITSVDELIGCYKGEPLPVLLWRIACSARKDLSQQNINKWPCILSPVAPQLTLLKLRESTWPVPMRYVAVEDARLSRDRLLFLNALDAELFTLK